MRGLGQQNLCQGVVRTLSQQKTGHCTLDHGSGVSTAAPAAFASPEQAVRPCRFGFTRANLTDVSLIHPSRQKNLSSTVDNHTFHGGIVHRSETFLFSCRIAETCVHRPGP